MKGERYSLKVPGGKSRAVSNWTVRWTDSRASAGEDQNWV